MIEKQMQLTHIQGKFINMCHVVQLCLHQNVAVTQ